MTRTHSIAVKLSGSRTITMTKFEVVNQKATSRVLLPPEQLGSQASYIKGLKDCDKVEVMAATEVMHKLVGKPSNNKRALVETLFISYVREHRRPTGRTADKTGRFHGAEYHLSTVFQVLVKSRNKDKPCKHENYEILSEAFIASLPPEVKALTGKARPPTAGWVGTDWFPRLFGNASSVYGYTTICPKQTDKCNYCCQLRHDMASIRESIKRHRQQGDQGSIERQTQLLAVMNDLKATEEEEKLHIKLCGEAEACYKESITGAHDAYRKACAVWQLLMQACSLPSTCTQEEEIRRLTDQLQEVGLIFRLASDYQEEKLLPHWGKSPQPGATFFMSKRNVHVHIMDVPSCGERYGASVFGRRVIYNRLETEGGSKDSNDTVCTVLDYLFSPANPTCQQPTLYRTGYDDLGPIPDYQVADINRDNEEEVLVSAEVADGLAVHPNMNVQSAQWQVPAPYVAIQSAPPEEQLEFRAEQGDNLVGAVIFYKRPMPDGWGLGTIERQNLDGRVKVNGAPANFIVEYGQDEAEAKYALDTASYAHVNASGGISEDSPDHTWLLCRPSSATLQRTSPVGMSLATSIAPAGYSIQSDPPPHSWLEFRHANGKNLIGREIVCNWGSQHGWCKGKIIQCNTSANNAVNHKKVNFIVAYPDDPCCKSALSLEEYCSTGDPEAPEWSWALLQEAAVQPPLQPLPYSNIEFSVQHPHPFIRFIEWWMDNCAGTNKNQYVKGSCAFNVALGILDAVVCEYMIAGHTKFEPDDTARHTAGTFNSSDTFNPAMWNAHCRRHATACFYDASMLCTMKEVTAQLFRAVDNITIYHSFLLLGDDGHVELKALCPTSDERMAVYKEKETGLFYSNADLMAQLQKLQHRSLPSVVNAVRHQQYTGIGAGCGLYSTGTPQFFPHKLKHVRHVRLFKRIHQTDNFWIEQEKYQKTRDPAAYCNALKHATVYSQSTIPGQCMKPYWGQRMQNIKDQYAKFVPPKYVEDEFELADAGCSGILSP